MKIKVYAVTADQRVSRSWYFNKGASAVTKARFLKHFARPGTDIVIEHRPSQRFFFL